MEAQTIQRWYQAALKQIAAESYFQRVFDLSNSGEVTPWLLRGNSPEDPQNPNDPGNQYVRMIGSQADTFLGRYRGRRSTSEYFLRFFRDGSF